MTSGQTGPESTERRIEAQEALEGFRALHPSFEACWVEALHSLEDLAEQMVYAEFAHTLEELLTDEPAINLSPIMSYIEDLMRRGAEDVQNAVAAYFIEALLGAADDNPKTLAPALRRLGPLSRDYALGWNRFLGRENEGLEW